MGLKNVTVSYLSQKVAQQIDLDLMGPDFGFGIQQLMELAGLSCAQALTKVYPPSTHPRILVCCGPGNQGGDGLVAARHLWHFGHRPSIFYPKQTDKELYKNLLKQCQKLNIPIVCSNEKVEIEKEFKQSVETSDVILDALFGFSFKPPIRSPFVEPIKIFKETEKPIVSVDIPSGWDVEDGNPDQSIFSPQVLISLTLPKIGAKKFNGRHFLGGRFVPQELAEKYKLKIPDYPGSDQVVEITDAISADN